MVAAASATSGEMKSDATMFSSTSVARSRASFLSFKGL
jgi:hypothetical protein